MTLWAGIDFSDTNSLREIEHAWMQTVSIFLGVGLHYVAGVYSNC